MKGMLNRESLLNDLHGLDLHPSCCLMIHASLSSLGVVEGGPQTVVEALREVAGEEGAVIVPSFRDAIRSDHYALRKCQKECPQPLCPSPETGYSGIIGETVRRQPDALRSCHPTHSWVGVGGSARFLLEGHRNSPTPCGKDSPFFRLMEQNGVVLLLGVGVNSLTNIHAVEDVRNVPYLSAIDPAHRHATYTTSGRRIQYVYPELLLTALREVGIVRKGKTGLAESYVVSARDLGAFLWIAVEDDPWCLVLRPRGTEFDPFQDACIKVSGMVSAWRARPEQSAWSELLRKSKEPEFEPVAFAPAEHPAENCPAYRGVVRGYHRCAANDLPPWEKFEDHPDLDPGVATCDHCNWPNSSSTGGRLPK